MRTDQLSAPAPAPVVHPVARLLRSGRPLVCGVLNVTPASFSDGGRFLRPEVAVARGC
ncbi:hypothetical protein [Geodermatophilus sp. SYSU D01176]